jgi:hypothetical protein
LKRVLRNDKVTHQIKNMVLRFMGEGVPACPGQTQVGKPIWSLEKNADRLSKHGLKTIFFILGCLPLGTG